MFGLFKSNENACPVAEEMRLWIENSMLWLIHQFSEEKILNLKTLVPTPEHFPINFDGTEQVAYSVLEVVARQMDVNPDEITIDFFDEHLLEFRGDGNQVLFTEQDENENYAVGLYYGRNSEGKFDIHVERKQLLEPEKLVAT